MKKYSIKHEYDMWIIIRPDGTKWKTKFHSPEAAHKAIRLTIPNYFRKLLKETDRKIREAKKLAETPVNKETNFDEDEDNYE